MELLQLLIGGIANGCIYGLIALGFVLIYKATELLNFAQGDLMVLGAYVVLSLVNTEGVGLPFWLGLLGAVVFMGCFSFGVDRIVIRPLFGQPAYAVIILTIALGFVIRFLIGAIWGHDPVSIEHPYAGSTITLPLSEGRALVMGTDDLLVIAMTTLLTLLLYLFFARTQLGLAMQACSQNQLAAYYMGVPVKRIYSLVWALAGALATIAGALFAMKGTLDPNSGLLGIKAFAAAVIGGFGSLPGALLGGMIVGISEPFAARYLAAGYSQITPYVIMLAVLVVAPNGLFAQIQMKKV